MNTKSKGCPHCGKRRCKGSCLLDFIKNDLNEAEEIIEKTMIWNDCGFSINEAFEIVCPDLHKMGYTFEMVKDCAKIMRETVEEIE